MGELREQADGARQDVIEVDNVRYDGDNRLVPLEGAAA